MADLNLALPFVLKHEGGWSDDPADPGGATNYGITLATAQRHGIADADALKAITPDQVEAIYRADYWYFDGVDDQAVATKVFDMAVNMGPGVAIHILQDCLLSLGATLRCDGVWGPKTEAAVNAAAPAHLLDLLCDESGLHYRAIVSAHPERAKFLKGWLARAEARP